MRVSLRVNTCLQTRLWKVFSLPNKVYPRMGYSREALYWEGEVRYKRWEPAGEVFRGE